MKWNLFSKGSAAALINAIPSTQEVGLFELRRRNSDINKLASDQRVGERRRVFKYGEAAWK